MQECIYKEKSPMTFHGKTYENEFCNKNNCSCCGETSCSEKEFEKEENV